MTTLYFHTFLSVSLHATPNQPFGAQLQTTGNYSLIFRSLLLKQARTKSYTTTTAAVNIFTEENEAMFHHTTHTQKVKRINI